HVEALGPRLEFGERLGAVRERGRLVSEALEGLGGQGHEGFLVVYDQYALALAAHHRRLGIVARDHWRLHLREVDGEAAALSPGAGHVDRADRVRDDAVDDRETQSGSLAHLLGGEKRLEQALER